MAGKKGRKNRVGGLFLTFEGPEGSGKSTLMGRFRDFLRRRAIPLVVTREPGGSALGLHLRDWILNQRKRRFSPKSELFLFLADRAQHVEEVVKPALRAGKIVLCDRYTDSTLAYQGGGRGFSADALRRMNDFASGGLRPHFTVLCDVPVEVGLRRAHGRSRGKDRMEREKLAFHRRVRKEFLKIASKEPGRVLVLDGRKKPDEVFEDLRTGLSRRLDASWRRKLFPAER